jgi:hypothetical protein
MLGEQFGYAGLVLDGEREREREERERERKRLGKREGRERGAGDKRERK